MPTRACFLLLTVLISCPFPASAVSPLMAIREVYVGPTDNPNAQYVLLQMYDSGQNLVSGHAVNVYDSTGGVIGTYTFSADVANGANQSYLWIATSRAQTLFGIDADLDMTATLPADSGKVCFDTVDCFSWGNYMGDSINPSPSGNPFSPTYGLTSGMAARRDISGGMSSITLESADDTNDSAADFDSADPNPVNNAGEAGSLPEPAPEPEPGYGGGGGGGGGGYGGGGGGVTFSSFVLLGLIVLIRRMQPLSQS